MITLLEIKTRAREMADMVNSTFISESELLSYINSSYTELYDIIVSKYEDYYIIDSAVSLAIGENTIDLPVDFYKLKALDYKISNGNWRDVNKFNFNKRNKINNKSYSMGNVEYRIIGNKIRIEPEDNASGDYKIWYTPKATRLVNNNDTVNDVNGWEEYIIVDVAIKMLAKEESSTTHLERVKAKLEARIEVMSQNRDEQPECVIDVNEDDEFWI